MSQETQQPLHAPPKMSAEQVAVRLGCGVQTVRRRRLAGLLNPVERNGRLEFDAAEVEELHRNPPARKKKEK